MGTPHFSAIQRRELAIAVVVAAVSVALSAGRQTTTVIHAGQGGSPHVRSEWMIHGASISIEYGRPFLKGRRLSELAPPGRIWRTGADEATSLTTTLPLTFGALAVPAGSYTLYTVPGDTEWQLVVNAQTGQWGTVYDDRQDRGRVPLAVNRRASSVEQLTIAIDETKTGGVLRIDWANVTVTTAFAVKQGRDRSAAQCPRRDWPVRDSTGRRDGRLF